jgi:hypothetical protein
MVGISTIFAPHGTQTRAIRLWKNAIGVSPYVGSASRVACVQRQTHFSPSDPAACRSSGLHAFINGPLGQQGNVMKTLQLYMHTNKAISRGEPADRVFLVVKRDGKFLIAWKCTLMPNGLKHPAFKSSLAFEDIQNGTIEHGKNDSHPSAMFRPDSLYRKVTVAQLRHEASKKA